MKPEDIERLAHLSRLSISNEEKESFSKDFSSILDYVSEIEEVAGKEEKSEVGVLRNIFRLDGPEHVSGEHTESILKNAPKTKNSFIEVKQVFE